jgi:hypothetical protein
MPRNSTRPEYILAMSQAGVARALGIRPERVAEAIDAGHLVAHHIAPTDGLNDFGRANRIADLSTERSETKTSGRLRRPGRLIPSSLTHCSQSCICESLRK